MKKPPAALAVPPHFPPLATGLCVSVWCTLSRPPAISQPGTRTSCWPKHKCVNGACAAYPYRGSLLRNTPGAGSSCAAAGCALGGGKWLEPQARGSLVPIPCLTKGKDIQCQLGSQIPRDSAGDREQDPRLSITSVYLENSNCRKMSPFPRCPACCLQVKKKRLILCEESA